MQRTRSQRTQRAASCSRPSKNAPSFEPFLSPEFRSRLGSHWSDASAVSILIEALREDDSWVNYSAAIAVGKIGPEAKQAVTALIELMKSKRATDEMVPALSISYQVRKLGEINVVDVGPGVPRLPGTGTVGYAAFWALSQIDPALAKASLPD